MREIPTREELTMLQHLPLEIKILKTKQRIREWVDEFGVDGVYISFSGGKDSTVLLHLVRELYPDIEAVFVDTGLEYPEIKEFVKTFDNVTILRPKMSFKEVIEKFGYPVISKEVSNTIANARYNIKTGTDSLRLRQLRGFEIDNNGNKSMFNKEKYLYLLDAPFKISDKCCYYMKKSPAHKFIKQTGKVAITGQIADESRLRLTQWIKFGCNGFNMKQPISNPLSFWTEQDILQYIHQYNIKICSVYGELVPYADENQLTFDKSIIKLKLTGCQRTGCMFCMFGVHLEKEPNRFQKMKITHPKIYDYCINNLGLGNVLDFIKVKY